MLFALRVKILNRDHILTKVNVDGMSFNTFYMLPALEIDSLAAISADIQV
jgi:hypothetical protein